MKTDIFSKTKVEPHKGFKKVFEVLTDTTVPYLPEGSGQDEAVMTGDLVYLLKQTKDKQGKKYGIVRLLNHFETPKQHCIYAIEMNLIKPHEIKEETSSADAAEISASKLKEFDADKYKPLLVGGLAAIGGYWAGVKTQADIKIPPYVWALGFGAVFYFATEYFMNKNKLSKIENNVIIS